MADRTARALYDIKNIIAQCKHFGLVLAGIYQNAAWRLVRRARGRHTIFETVNRKRDV